MENLSRKLFFTCQRFNVEVNVGSTLFKLFRWETLVYREILLGHKFDFVISQL